MQRINQLISNKMNNSEQNLIWPQNSSQYTIQSQQQSINNTIDTEGAMENQIVGYLKVINNTMENGFTTVNQGLTKLSTDMNYGFTKLSKDMNYGFTKLSKDMNYGFTKLSKDMNYGFTKLSKDMNYGFTVLSQQIETGFSRIQNSYGLKKEVKYQKIQKNPISSYMLQISQEKQDTNQNQSLYRYDKRVPQQPIQQTHMTDKKEYTSFSQKQDQKLKHISRQNMNQISEILQKSSRIIIKQILNIQRQGIGLTHMFFLEIYTQLQNDFHKEFDKLRILQSVFTILQKLKYNRLTLRQMQSLKRLIIQNGLILFRIQQNREMKKYENYNLEQSIMRIIISQKQNRTSVIWQNVKMLISNVPFYRELYCQDSRNRRRLLKFCSGIFTHKFSLNFMSNQFVKNNFIKIIVSAWLKSVDHELNLQFDHLIEPLIGGLIVSKQDIKKIQLYGEEIFTKFQEHIKSRAQISLTQSQEKLLLQSSTSIMRKRGQ